MAIEIQFIYTIMEIDYTQFGGCGNKIDINPC
jgi:hypothetical protein